MVTSSIYILHYPSAASPGVSLMAPAKGRALEWRYSYKVCSLWRWLASAYADFSRRFGAHLRVGRSSEKFTPALKINKTRVIIPHWKQSEERHSYSNKRCFICLCSLFCLHRDGLACCFAEQMFVIAFIPLTSTTHSKALSGALAGWQARMLQQCERVTSHTNQDLYDMMQTADKCWINQTWGIMMLKCDQLTLRQDVNNNAKSYMWLSGKCSACKEGNVPVEGWNAYESKEWSSYPAGEGDSCILWLTSV